VTSTILINRDLQNDNLAAILSVSVGLIENRLTEFKQFKLIFSISRHVHITLLLRSLHWLRVPEWIEFRLAVHVSRCLHGLAPVYLSAKLVCLHVGSRQRLRYAMTSALVGHRTQRITIGDRAFTAAAPAICNSLSEEVRSATSLPVFRCHLKLELFKHSFSPGLRGTPCD